jgi:glutamine cyclotransferase
VTLDGQPVEQLNELNASATDLRNVWQTDQIMRIDKASGQGDGGDRRRRSAQREERPRWATNQDVLNGTL